MPALEPLRAGAAGAAAAGAASLWLPEPPRDAQPALASATRAVMAQRAAGEWILFPIEMLLECVVRKRAQLSNGRKRFASDESLKPFRLQ